VFQACRALYRIGMVGSEAVKSAIKQVPDIKPLLKAAKASGLDDGQAAHAMKVLGLDGCVVQ
jgi:hypothetical protein